MVGLQCPRLRLGGGEPVRPRRGGEIPPRRTVAGQRGDADTEVVGGQGAGDRMPRRRGAGDAVEEEDGDVGARRHGRVRGPRSGGGAKSISMLPASHEHRIRASSAAVLAVGSWIYDDRGRQSVVTWEGCTCSTGFSSGSWPDPSCGSSSVRGCGGWTTCRRTGRRSSPATTCTSWTRSSSPCLRPAPSSTSRRRTTSPVAASKER